MRSSSYRSLISGFMHRSMLHISSVIAVLLMFSAPAVQAQLKHEAESALWSASISSIVYRFSAKDDAYSSVSYSNWAPSVNLNVSVEKRRHTHRLDAEYSDGNLSHPSGQDQELNFSQWGFRYNWMLFLGSYQDEKKFRSSIGARFSLHQMKRTYAGFLNSDLSRDRWAAVSILGKIQYRIDEGARFILLAEGALGLVGLFYIDSKQPEWSPDLKPDGGSDIAWMPGPQAAAWNIDVQLLYRLGKRHHLGIGFISETTTYQVSRFWGFVRNGIQLKYAISL
jgi:hypothetical protein